MLIAAIVLSLLGIAAFVFLFAHDFNIYWLILSPAIFAIYQFPAVFMFWLHKRKKNKARLVQPVQAPIPCEMEEDRLAKQG